MPEKRNITLLPTTTIAAAVTAVTTTAVPIGDVRYLLIEAAFLYGSGGTTAKFWIQTRVKDGTWRDIANFAFLLAAATKWHSLKAEIAVAAARTASDAALADDTILDGFIGDEIRVKYTTTGTYAGATSITIRATAK